MRTALLASLLASTAILAACASDPEPTTVSVQPHEYTPPTSVYTQPRTTSPTSSAPPVPRSSAPPASVADALFIASADEYGVQYNADAEIIALGHRICDQINGGVDPWDLSARFVNEAAWTAPAAGAIVGSAVAVYCPEHGNKIE